jgi:hypothetical protein
MEQARKEREDAEGYEVNLDALLMSSECVNGENNVKATE